MTIFSLTKGERDRHWKRSSTNSSLTEDPVYILSGVRWAEKSLKEFWSAAYFTSGAGQLHLDPPPPCLKHWAQRLAVNFIICRFKFCRVHTAACYDVKLLKSNHSMETQQTPYSIEAANSALWKIYMHIHQYDTAEKAPDGDTQFITS